MFLVMRMISDLEIESLGTRATMSLKADDGQVGMIPVFGTREQAQIYADSRGGAAIVEIAAKDRSTGGG